MILIHIKSIFLPLGRTTSFIICIHIIIVFICSLTNPGSCHQDLCVPVLSIQGISECVAGISSLVTFHDFICDSKILDTQLQGIFVTFLFCGQSVNSFMIVQLRKMASDISTSTKNTAKYLTQLLSYAHTRPDF